MAFETFYEQFSIVSPIGKMQAIICEKGICQLQFEQESITKPKKIDFVEPIENDTLSKYPNLIKNIRLQLLEYFEGNRKNFELPLALAPSVFQKNIWQNLQTIPYGTTITYAEQALNLKQPKAIRAIAHCNGLNPIAIIIPCHRVIGSHGKLTGYAAGIWRKRWLLEHERKNTPLGSKLL